jgi:hypothetical protein
MSIRRRLPLTRRASHAAGASSETSRGGRSKKEGGKGTRAGGRKRGGPAGGMESVPELSISGDAGRRAAPGRRPAGPARKRSVGGSIGAVEFCRSDGQCALHACRVRSSGW